MAASDTGSWLPLLGSSVVRGAMQEGAKVQMAALLGADAEQETPLFDGGLVAAPDGLSWLPSPA